MLPLDTIRCGLDVGSGTGFSILHAPPGIQFAATDLSWRMLSENICNRRVLAEAYRLPFADASFDVVMCWEVLHHIAAPVIALAEMRRVSRRWVLLFEPNPLNIFQFLFALIDREHRWVLRFSKKYLMGQIIRADLAPMIYRTTGLIFPNKTPAPIARILAHLPFHIPLVGISQCIVAVKGST